MTHSKVSTGEEVLRTDVVVVGSGPAGLSAAAAATEAGRRVVVVDLAPRTGGQYWRHAAEAEGEDLRPRGHHDWGVYLGLRARCERAERTGRLTRLQGTQVWSAEPHPGGEHVLRLSPTPELLHGSQAPAGTPDVVLAPTVILCTGAYDRQLPVPGWELPGVMAAGGVQAFIKVNGRSPGRRAVVAGTGPFLLSVAAGILAAGGEVAAVCESSSLTGWAPHLGAAAAVPSKGREGLEYAAALLRHRVPYRTRTVVTRILGEDRASGVRIASVDSRGRVRPGTERVVEDVDVVGLGWGFTPQLELPVALGVDTRVDVDGSLVGITDQHQRSSVPGVFLAGEVTGVGGAALAVAEGTIAGAVAAGATAPVRALRTRRAHRRFAASMHAAHPVPSQWAQWLTPETLVCRCEEVASGTLARATTTLGAEDSRSAKGTTRVGMGWCQGRVCGFASTCLSAGGGEDQIHRSLLASAKRPMAAPVALGRLAALDDRRDPLPLPETPAFTHPIPEETL
nr:FAD-dependent oxidoreductase [Kocuria rhizophila]